MSRGAHPNKVKNTIFSQVLAEKRKLAGMSLSDLADLTLLPISMLEALEIEGEQIPSFDVCYKIGQAINSRRMQGFMIQDLWQAAALDRTTRYSYSAYATHHESAAVQRKAA